MRPCLTWGPKRGFTASCPATSPLAVNMKVTWEEEIYSENWAWSPDSHQNMPSSLQGCVGLEVPLSIRVNFSSHSSFWNEPNLSHLFLELFPEVEILISFYPLDIRVRKWTCQSGIFNLVILKQCSTFKFDGRVAVNFSLSSDRLYIVIYLYVCQAMIPFIWLYNWLLVTHCFPTACSAPLTTASTFLPFPSWLSQPPGQRWSGRPRRSHQMILPSKMIKGLCYAFALDDFIIKSKNACHTMCQVSF